jgi:hypothetical protein
MTSTELMSFAAFLRNYDKAQPQPTPTRPNRAALRQRELMRRAADTVARQQHGHHNPNADTITLHPTTEPHE